MTYLFVAYTIVWLAIFAYSYSLGQQTRRLSAQVEALEAALKAEGKSLPPSATAGGRAGRE